MAKTRRSFMQQVFAGAGGVIATPRLSHAISTAVLADGPDPLFEKPAPVTMAELGNQSPKAVTVTEVNDYTTGHYHGTLAPSPPHADMNPKKAFVVAWK